MDGFVAQVALEVLHVSTHCDKYGDTTDDMRQMHKWDMGECVAAATINA